MITKIKAEQPFQVLATNFSISPSNEDYTLQISADGENYSDLFTVSAGQTKMCTGMANGSFYRLKNNESDVEVNWRTQCNDGGSGGGGGSQYILPPATANNLGGIKVGEGLSITNEGVLSTNGGGGSIDSGAVQTQIDESINAFSQELQGGEPIVGMAAQLYSPDGVTSEGWYNYRTTAGDEDVNTGDAELRKIEGNATYPEPTYTDSGALTRGGEPVEGFSIETYWGGSIQWNTVGRLTDFRSTYPNTKLARISITDTLGYYAWTTYGGGYEGRITKNGSSWVASVNTVATEDPNVFIWRITGQGDVGTFRVEGNYVVIEATGYRGYIFQLDGPNQSTYEVGTGSIIPNDIPFGESTYTYSTADTAWTPSLPQAVTSMTLNSETYVPQDGDEITITREYSVTGSAVYMKPTAFVALGLNSFDYTAEGILSNVFEEGHRYNYNNEEEGEYDSWIDTAYTTYSVYAVTGLENGYIVHYEGGSFIRNNNFGGVADTAVWEEGDIDTNIDFSNTELVNGDLVVYPTTAMPYIIFSVPTEDADKICVHPRWSGKMDEGFEEYQESVIDLSNLVDDCPLLSIGEVRNTIDLQNKKFVERISREVYSNEAVEALVEDGKVLGTDFNIDEDYIYVVNSTPQEDDIDIDAAYKDNDFSVEYFVDENGIIPQKVFAENYYITNLVDKLRRMENYFIHLDSPDTAGEVGKTYEYQGRLMKWVEGSGYTAEWLRQINNVSDGEGTGLIYASIPNGQTLFEFKTKDSDAWRKVIYSGDTLYYAETGGSVVCAVTIDNNFIFEGISYGGQRRIKGVYKNGYIGFLRNSNLCYLQNVWDGRVEGGHYELIDKYNHPYNGESSTVTTSIPIWNGNGQIVGNAGSVSTKNIFINTTGTSYSNRTTFYTNGTNYGPDRWFAPVTGGDTGQTLVSAGANAAPVWETRIKVVKITSADYEALVQAGTTDPNTLYAIDDE